MKLSTKTITLSGVLAAISAVIMMLEFNIPFMPEFLKIDFSDVPALLGALAVSPYVGIFVLAVKNLVHLPLSITGGIGELANFIIGSCYILPIALIYHQKKTYQYLLIGVVIGILIMTTSASLFNQFVLLPMYAKFMNMEAIIAMGSKVNPTIHSKLTLVLYAIVPFNIIKGLINSILSLLLLKYIPKKIICKA